MTYYDERERDRIVEALLAYSRTYPDTSLTVAVDNHALSDHRIYVFDGDQVQARIWIRGCPTPQKQRFLVDVVNKWTAETEAMLTYANIRLDDKLRQHYRGNRLRPSIVPPLQDLLY